MTIKHESFMYLSVGSKWKKKYFVLDTNGTLNFGDSRKNVKTGLKITENTQISQLPASELGGDYGFIITTPGTSNRVVMKNKDKNEAGRWFSSVREVINIYKARSVNITAKMGDLYAGGAMKSNKNIRGNRTAASSFSDNIDMEVGWVMKVGKSKNASDFFVNAKTWEYFDSKEACLSGRPCVGKALLSLLV
mmetsp:Transcript_15834/g.17878  ORF Transcript_15834/g.17878 Transcript_15834/m.17878 type:complete len:192 (+) Transcript_15834:261-836(+)|eukprot:CAMPEP_0184009306 /NCGR_PEP_ID=MMETSP0954-20121128/2509_1 /TAXON_ID=627963 /ORGANISM="Aplanochytrium sp, Strain PBS07" /LENGTH=191 /DNA_ID=CAMNT_0026288619 /DNA_START=210 /DNA_END=785 /DNA_ORIENTATION=+